MTDSAYDHEHDDEMLGITETLLDRAKAWFVNLSNRTVIVAGVVVMVVTALLVVLTSFASSNSTAPAAAAVPLDSRFDFSNSEPAIVAKQAEFRRLVLQKFGDQAGFNAAVQQQLNDIAKTQKVDPKVLESIQKDIDELKKLILLKDKVAEIEKVNKSLAEKLASLLVSPANAQTAPPPAPPVDFVRYDNYVKECEGVKTPEPSKKEVDARELNKQPEAMYEDILTQCREKRKPNTSVSAAPPPGSSVVAPETIAAVGRLRYVRVLRDCDGVWTPTAGKERENIEGFNKMSGDEFNQFTQKCLAVRTASNSETPPAEPQGSPESQQGRAVARGAGGGNPYAGNYDYSQVVTITRPARYK